MRSALGAAILAAEAAKEATDRLLKKIPIKEAWHEFADDAHLAVRWALNRLRELEKKLESSSE